MLIVAGSLASCGTAGSQGPVAGFMAPKFGLSQLDVDRSGGKIGQESLETASKFNVVTF